MASLLFIRCSSWLLKRQLFSYHYQFAVLLYCITSTPDHRWGVRFTNLNDTNCLSWDYSASFPLLYRSRINSLLSLVAIKFQISNFQKSCSFCVIFYLNILPPSHIAEILHGLKGCSRWGLLYMIEICIWIIIGEHRRVIKKMDNPEKLAT